MVYHVRVSVPSVINFEQNYGNFMKKCLKVVLFMKSCLIIVLFVKSCLEVVPLSVMRGAYAIF